MQTIKKYFPNLTQLQTMQFEQLDQLYNHWNAAINVISRKDIQNLYPNHVLHSLALAEFLGPLETGTTLMDIGTGGGFPGIPLAIVYPQCRFHLIDRIGKKLRVASEVAKEIGLKNVTFQHGDVGECREKFNYVVSRAVMPLNDLVRLVTKNISQRDGGNTYANGVVVLKGGDLTEESKGIRFPVIEYNINELFAEPQFETKKVVYVPIK
ncbi:16S rRNA (guanine(527)-N(7))-methyltransferase RsmG [uncultured Muribaculum sp.]|uniref:16S rRNA (guanine(527)-N(7))-methyltransferase RsmG n=1 Tax=uncultured Muribaculum sp. TaxID=1918613 RepID=UPI0026378DDE|nr:16S rRNA (guanine(527)-N(7))-methyltransferase RsmG [uncultured Muribaculum sp.]